MKKALKHLAIGMLTLAMSFSLSVSAFAAEPVDTADMSSTEMSAEMESVTRAGNSWVGLLTSEVQIGSGTFLGRDISCYNHIRVRERFSSVSLGALLSELFLAADANSKMCGASRRFLPRRSPVTARIRSLGLIDLSKNRFDMS